VADEHNYSMKMRLAVNLGGGDDANVNFQWLVTELFSIGRITRLMQNYGRLPCVHKLKSLENQSTCGSSRDAGTDVNRTGCLHKSTVGPRNCSK